MPHILSKLVFKYKRWRYSHYHYPKNKYKNYGFNLIWSLGLEAWSAASGGLFFSFSLRDPSAGKVTKASCFSKSWEAASGWGASVTLSDEESFKVSYALPCSGWTVEGGCWGGASLVDCGARGADSACLGTCRAKGKIMLSGLLSPDEASTPA